MSESAEPDDLTAERDDDSNLVRHLRAKVKEANRELAQLRASGTADSGEGDEPREKQEPRGLRQAFERQSARLKELEAANRAQSLKAAFDAAGVPPGELRDLIGAKIDDPSSVTVEGLQDWMRSNGVAAFDPVGAHRSAVTQRVDELRASAVPVGSQRMPWGDFKQLQQSDPSSAASALTRGQVEIPGYVAQQLEANRREREQHGGTFGE